MTITNGILPNGKQQFLTSNGTPLAGGFVYYYIPSTTTFKTTYKDDLGTTANTNPIVLDANGQCIAYGSGSYRQQVYDVNNNLIWDVQVDAPITLPQIESIYSASNGSSLIGYQQGATNTVAETVQTKLQESVSVKDFGAVGDGVTDDTVAIQNCLNWARTQYSTTLSPNNSYVKVLFPPAIYKVTGSLYLAFASNGAIPGQGSIEIIGDGAVIIGGGSLSSSFDCFVSAYWNGTTNVPTLGTTPETYITYGVHVHGFVIQNFRRAFSLQDWLVNCRIYDINCNNCQSAIYMRYCFFSQYENINSSGAPTEQGSTLVLNSTSGFTIGETLTGGTTGLTCSYQSTNSASNTLNVNNITGQFKVGETITGGTSGATSTVVSFTAIGNFDLGAFENIAPLKSCVGGSHEIAFKLDGANGTLLQDCNMETCRIGVYCDSQSNQATLLDCYIESNTVAAIYISGLTNLSLIGCFINQGSYQVINGNQLVSGNYAQVNFTNCNLYSGNFATVQGIYGTYINSSIAPFPFTNSKIVNLAPQSLVNVGGSGYNANTQLVDWNHSQQHNPGFYRSTFGSSSTGLGTSGASANAPFQTLVASAGTSSGTKWTFTTQITADYNIFGTWFLRWADSSTVRTRNFFIMAETADTSGAQTTFNLYERNSSTNVLNTTTVSDTNFTATQVGGYLVLIADNLSSPSLASSIVRVF